MSRDTHTHKHTRTVDVRLEYASGRDMSRHAQKYTLTTPVNRTCYSKNLCNVLEFGFI